MQDEAFVSATAWLAVVCWFGGAIARIGVGASSSPRRAGYLWFVGAVVILIHIVTSYAIVHNWSHAEAIRVTAEESERVTGVRAGWGVYVNFAFVVVWLGYAFALVRDQNLPALLERILFGATALVVFSATVVFEAGVPRILSSLGFAVILLMGLLKRVRCGDCCTAANQ